MSRRTMTFACFILILVAAAGSSQAADKPAGKISFKRKQLDNVFRAEGAGVGDFNHDGKLDVAAGSVYYAAPDWKMHVVGDTTPEYDPHVYSNSFCTFVDDLNGDGVDDIISVDFPGKETWWFENSKNAEGPWKRHVCTPITNNESPQYLDVDGDGKRDLLCGAGDVMAYVTPGSDAHQVWKVHDISGATPVGTNRFSHGLGLGDVNGDGRNDVLVNDGWWEHPASKADEPWHFHKVEFAPACSQMYVYDFDGDGDGDVLACSAHQTGVWWVEQTEEGWKRHEIDTSFSQTHSCMLADINGDGLQDFVTGKRWWAHGPSGDPGSEQPAVIFWFELAREDGKPKWTRHDIDHDSGVGTQFDVADLNGDGLLDVITGNKKGVNFFTQVRE